MKTKCKWCGKKIDNRGMLSHEYFRHSRMLLASFRTDSAVILYGLANGWNPSMQLALSAPNPLTVYSTRPLGYMAAPIPEHRRPKGYYPPQNYARPFETLRA